MVCQLPVLCVVPLPRTWAAFPAVAVEACARNVQHNMSRATNSEAQRMAPDGQAPSTALPGQAQAAGQEDVGATASSAGAGEVQEKEGSAREGAGEKSSAGDERRARLRKVKPEEGDARLYMLLHENQFDAVRPASLGPPSLTLGKVHALCSAWCCGGCLCQESGTQDSIQLHCSTTLWHALSPHWVHPMGTLSSSCG